MKQLGMTEFLGEMARGVVAYDVRTPAEFAKGHIPGALNLPLFEDEERVVVGTLYKEEGRQRAILEGLGFVGPRMRELVERVQAEVGASSGPVLVHCWRGGMRSQSVAWLLELYGFEVCVLKGGYKSYRRWAIEQMEDIPPLVVLGGRTGVGKTEILWALREQGEEVVDLEGLANHRGSAFGGLLLGEQPTQEHFENKLGMALALARRSGSAVWVEDESRMIGFRHLPNALIKAIHRSPCVVVDAPLEERLDRLVGVYGDAANRLLADAFERIKKSLGGLRTAQARAALDAGDVRAAAALALEYYDKAYAKGIARRDADRVIDVDTQGTPRDVALRLIEVRDELAPTGEVL
ncbi:tRNA 2-selenouridine(34) synthase MnmH [Lujinxingia sediminis]|uniref:tRNA 2-selenouridine(34) synthase MnmH n=1 Tax=Lujinxingia sediminis TaxID=2480984 RepID=A0ABY0CXE1_9DELT|nr:tRNA 2-selenouridine(34) synthase MnmH [Lujinxingia sediminis]RVU48551.1 tRNA 2-selenouridine(34) synthase MnmH [Lujinxingia sediminis]